MVRFRDIKYIRIFSGICKGNRGVCDEKLKNAEKKPVSHGDSPVFAVISFILSICPIINQRNMIIVF